MVPARAICVGGWASHQGLGCAAQAWPCTGCPSGCHGSSPAAVAVRWVCVSIWPAHIFLHSLCVCMDGGPGRTGGERGHVWGPAGALCVCLCVGSVHHEANVGPLPAPDPSKRCVCPEPPGAAPNGWVVCALGGWATRGRAGIVAVPRGCCVAAAARVSPWSPGSPGSGCPCPSSLCCSLPAVMPGCMGDQGHLCAPAQGHITRLFGGCACCGSTHLSQLRDPAGIPYPM